MIGNQLLVGVLDIGKVESFGFYGVRYFYQFLKFENSVAFSFVRKKKNNWDFGVIFDF